MPESDQRVNEVVAGIEGQCPVTRMGALIDAKNLLSGPIAEKPVVRLIEVLTAMVHLDGDGLRATPKIQCHNARLAATHAVYAAITFGHPIEQRHLDVLKRSARYDPHEWVSGAAESAIEVHSQIKGNRISSVPVENSLGRRPTLLRNR